MIGDPLFPGEAIENESVMQEPISISSTVAVEAVPVSLFVITNVCKP